MSTDNSYKEYEKKADEIRKHNARHLDGFEEYLQSLGLKAATINKHMMNVDFYINHFLLYYDALDVTHGCYKVGEFLGNWFIRKAMWSSVASIKSNITSLKKFYLWLFARW